LWTRHRAQCSESSKDLLGRRWSTVCVVYITDVRFVTLDCARGVIDPLYHCRRSVRDRQRQCDIGIIYSDVLINSIGIAEAAACEPHVDTNRYRDRPPIAIDPPLRVCRHGSMTSCHCCPAASLSLSLSLSLCVCVVVCA